jgi:hypothetical protein
VNPVQGAAARLLALALLAFAVGINLRLAKPFYNWDLVAYIAAVYAYSEDDAQAVHRKTFQELKENLPERAYREITEISRYRTAIAENPEYLAQQIPSYSVKPAYPALMLLLKKAGINLVSASVLISKLSYLGIAAVLFLWFSAALPPVHSALTTWVIVSLPSVLDLARFSTPDALSTLLILISLALFMERRQTERALFLMVVSVLARPDNLLLVMLMALYAGIFQKDKRRWALGYGFGSIGLYLLLTRLSGNYGWQVLFYNTMVQRVLEPATFVSTLYPGDYLKIYLNEAHPDRIFATRLIYFIPLNALALLICFERAGLRDLRFQLLMVNSLFMLAHWLVLPSQIDRYLVASYVFILVVLVKAVTELDHRAEKRRNSSR